MSMDIDTIKKTMVDLKHKGHQLNMIEAFLINTDDWCDLMNTSMYSGTEVQNSDGEAYICGIRIIENHHIPRGTIFKVFKDDGLLPPNQKWSYSDIATSGTVSNGLGEGVPPMQSGVAEIPTLPKLSVLPHTEYETIAEEVTETVEKRHSTTRKIELD